MPPNDHATWLSEAAQLLSAARRNAAALEPALRTLSRRAFIDCQFSPPIVFDYLMVSSPGLLMTPASRTTKSTNSSPRSSES